MLLDAIPRNGSAIMDRNAPIYFPYCCSLEKEQCYRYNVADKSSFRIYVTFLGESLERFGIRKRSEDCYSGRFWIEA